MAQDTPKRIRPSVKRAMKLVKLAPSKFMAFSINRGVWMEGTANEAIEFLKEHQIQGYAAVDAIDFIKFYRCNLVSFNTGGSVESITTISRDKIDQLKEEVENSAISRKLNEHS